MKQTLWVSLGAVLAVVVSGLTIYNSVEGRARARADVNNKIGDNEAAAERIEQRMKDWKSEMDKDIWVLEGKAEVLNSQINALRVEMARTHK